MKIGIIGAGSLGTGLARQLVKQNHAVMLSFTRDPSKLEKTARSLGTRTGTPTEAAAFGDVIVLTTPWTVTAEALKQAGPVSGNKILWDCTNSVQIALSDRLVFSA